MSAKLTIGTDGNEHDAFKLCVCPESGPTIDLYVSQERAEIEAIALSAMLPSTTIVRLEKHCRHKAVYRNGERLVVRDYADFYSNLTPEQYQATKILCSTSHQWV